MTRKEIKNIIMKSMETHCVVTYVNRPLIESGAILAARDIYVALQKESQAVGAAQDLR